MIDRWRHSTHELMTWKQLNKIAWNLPRELNINADLILDWESWELNRNNFHIWVSKWDWVKIHSIVTARILSRCVMIRERWDQGFHCPSSSHSSMESIHISLIHVIWYVAIALSFNIPFSSDLDKSSPKGMNKDAMSILVFREQTRVSPSLFHPC